MLLSAFINQYLKTNEEKDNIGAESKIDKYEIESQANFINENGKKFYPHEFIFEEDVPELVKFIKEESLKINLSNDQQLSLLK